jgi:hypothetical protein
MSSPLLAATRFPVPGLSPGFCARRLSRSDRDERSCFSTASGFFASSCSLRTKNSCVCSQRYSLFAFFFPLAEISLLFAIRRKSTAGVAPRWPQNRHYRSYRPRQIRCGLHVSIKGGLVRR